jgi:hypothetical protein
MDKSGATDQLLHRIKALSPADLSMLEGAVSRPGATLVTSPESENDLLWTDMELLGWLRGSVESFDLGNGKSLPLKRYALTDEGRKSIALLLPNYRGESQRPVEVIEKMTDLINTFCREFLEELMQRVEKAGGNRQDVQILLTHTLARYVKAGRSRDEAKFILERCFEAAEKFMMDSGSTDPL